MYHRACAQAVSSQSTGWLPKPPSATYLEYTSLMNQTETTVFFRALHDLEDARANALGLEAEELICQNPDYMEGYDYVMDIVKDAILEGEEVRNLTDLDNFVNQVDAYADDFEGEYGRGYQEAINLCLEAVSQLIQSEEV
jgi:hypothetical protein